MHSLPSPQEPGQRGDPALRYVPPLPPTAATDVTSPQMQAAILGADEPDDAPPEYEVELVRTRVAWSKLLWLLSTLALLLAIAQFIPHLVEQTTYALHRGKQRAEYEQAGQVLASSPLEALSVAAQSVSQRVAPSVVHIQTSDRNLDEVSLRHPLGGHRRSLTTGQGSGVIIDAEGFVLTNYHVVRGSQQIRVALSDGRRVTSRVVGVDSDTDLAVLHIGADKLIAAEWANSEEAQVGSMVWAVGSPFGLEQSVTSGILSGKHRAEMVGTAHQDFLQTDAAVNPGNSGGPLVDARGRVVGINTAIVGESYQGISFAVPSNVAKRVFDDIRQHGRVQRGWLGVKMDNVDENLAKKLRLPSANGVHVVEVVDQPSGVSPAAEAGIQVDDVIVSWNGKRVKNSIALTNLVCDTEIGSEATVVLIREGQELSLTVVVGLRPVIK